MDEILSAAEWELLESARSLTLVRLLRIGRGVPVVQSYPPLHVGLAWGRMLSSVSRSGKRMFIVEAHPIPAHGTTRNDLVDG
jgi:hypothetical protein